MLDTASNVNWEEEEAVQADTQATKHVKQLWTNVPAGTLGRSKPPSQPSYSSSFSRYILLMSSEGNATEYCKIIFQAISAVLVINDGLTGSPGRAITKDSAPIYENAKALFYLSFHLERQMQVILGKAARCLHLDYCEIPNAAPQEEHNAICMYHTHAQHLIIVALLVNTFRPCRLFSVGFCLQIPFLLSSVLLC